MVEIEDIRNSETLEAWLKQIIREKGKDEGRRIAILIAHRAAMRALPHFWLWVQDFARALERNLTPISLLRASIVAGAAGQWPTVELREAARDATHYASSFRTFTTRAAARPAEASARISAKIADIAARASAGTANSAGISSQRADIVVTYAAEAADQAAVIFPNIGWIEIRQDAKNALDIGVQPRPLWSGHNPLADIWAEVKSATMSAHEGHAHWSFWRRWYDDVLKGGPLRNAELLKAIALIDYKDWGKGAGFINDVKIPELQALYPDVLLETATPVEFSFDTLARVMRLIGVDDNLAHLKQPGVVQTFLDDAEEVRDGLQDFADYAGDLSGGGNYAGVLRRAADKVLSELSRADEKMQVRAERIVMLAQELESFSKEEKAAADLGPKLSEILDRRLEGLKSLCRSYFAPSYLSLAPLADVSLDQIDKDQVVNLFDRALDQIRALPSEGLFALDAEGMAVLEDMKREVADYRVAIAEASTDEFRELMEARMAQSAGGLALSFGRFLQRSSQAYGSVSKGTDETIKQYRRAKTLGDLMEVVEKFGSGS